MAVNKTGISINEISSLKPKAEEGSDQFEAIFLENWPKVYGLLLRLVGDQAEAEDLALESFMRLYRNPPNNNQEQNLGGWLHRVAMNLGLNALRSRQRRRRYEEEAGRLDLFENSSANPAEIFAAREQHRLTRRILAEMSPGQSQILILRYSGLSYREIAAVMGLAAGSIGPLLTRAETEFEKRFRARESGGKKMKHLDDGQLRGHLDGELDETSAKHLDDCSECQRRLSILETRKGNLENKLAFLDPSASPAAQRTAFQALVKFNKRVNEEKENPLMKRSLYPKFRPVWMVLAAVLIIAASFSIPSVRVWAGEFLGVFRVRQVTVIPIDTTGLSSLSGNSTLGNQIGQLLSNSINVTQQPDKPQTAADAAEASNLAGFQVRLPTNQTSAPQLSVQSGAAFTMVVNRARAQALLDEAGHSDLQLPASLDGAKIDVKIPAAVSAGYGACPNPAEQGSDTGLNTQGSPGRRFADCVMLVQIPSPTVNTPPDLDLAKLAEIGLEFTGMSPQQAQEFSKNVDWTSSLVIPIPRNAATYQQISVDGVTGTLIQRPMDDAPEYALVWVKDGIIYAIGGLGSDSARAIAMANSLK